jgi:hypothetical protein
MSAPKTPSTLTIRDVRRLFEISSDANVVRDCVRAIGAGVDGVFDSEVKNYQRDRSLARLATVFDAGRTPRVVATHRDFRITSVEFTQPYYIDGMFVWSGYNVCSEDGNINVMPGACWFMTLVEAMQGVDCLIEAGGSPRPPYRKDDDVGARFWALMRRRRDRGDSAHDPRDASTEDNA